MTIFVVKNGYVSRLLLRNALAVILLSNLHVSRANEMTGSVCLGKNLAKPLAEHTNRLHLRIDDSPPVHFVSPYTGPVFAARGLDLQKSHIVKIYFDSELVESWMLNFQELESSAVLIWRAAGSWRMEPIDAASCKDA